MNETSELQPIDVALGAHIAGAFAGFAPSGPANWREFITRPISKQVIRHDADSVQDFISAYLGSQKGEAVSDTGASVNQVKLPVAYYFRKPGFVNTMDQRGAKGRVHKSDKAFRLKLMPLALDYTINFVAFDKLSLDKLCIAWYAWIQDHGIFPSRYLVGGEPFDVKCRVQDNNNVILSNASFVEGGNRYYCATSTYTINSNILFGSEVTVPLQRLIYGFGNEPEERYVIPSETSHYGYDSASRPEGAIPFQPGTVQVWDGAGLLATDDGKGEIDVDGVATGAVDYYAGTVAFDLAEPPAGVVSVSFAPMAGSVEMG